MNIINDFDIETQLDLIHRREQLYNLIKPKKLKKKHWWQKSHLCKSCNGFGFDTIDGRCPDCRGMGVKA